MTSGANFRCARCETDTSARVGTAPFPDALGSRIADEVCVDCWEAWKKQQMLLINHYSLNVRDSAARRMLLGELRKFLFGEEVDEDGEGP